MNLFNIRRSFEQKKEKGWEYVFVALDVHETIIPSDNPYTFYPYVKETLQFLSNKEDVLLILNTCSHDDDINKLRIWLIENDIYISFVNENPIVWSGFRNGNTSLFEGVISYETSPSLKLKDISLSLKP